MAKLEIPIKLDFGNAPEVMICFYLMEEIKAEEEYNKLYEIEVERARKEAKEKGDGLYWKYINYDVFPHEARKSVIKDNAKMIRRLMLKLTKTPLKMA